tara:strand:- start:536 stop:1369 length:834 start_codon:yes stop_codon:yes gene_type:complete
MQIVANIIPYFRKELSKIFVDKEIVSFAYISIEHIFGFNRSECIIYSNKIISEKSFKKIIQIISELKKSKPIQYILEETFFYGLKFKVNKHTLIPRPETEELVEWILKENFESAIDICTGSGCIAISLSKFRSANILGIDISEEALKIAKENARLNNVEVDFICEDIFRIKQLKNVDLIVSNPPYVLASEKIHINKNVLDYEPHLALFVSDNDPLIFYERIAFLSKSFLRSGGKLFFEINEIFSSELTTMLLDLGFVDIELKKDINDKIRMIKATWK